MERYKACLAAEKISEHYQFTREFQSILDSAITIDPTWDYPYRAKSTAYLKSGDFITWKKLIDKAVAYDTLANLYYRGRCRFNFFRDYKGAIADFKMLKQVIYNQNKVKELLIHDDTHVDTFLALCYRSLGETEKAIEIMTSRMATPSYSSGLFDHLHLGCMYLEQEEYIEAIEQFKKQEAINDLAENRFYIAIAYKNVLDQENYLINLKTAKEYLQQGKRVHDYYVENIDKIYWANILEEEKGIPKGISVQK
ncbi:hypothetical protein GO009_02690 [Muricauda sp. TY007]|uniref:tetratricopeptide repeat protein n=1 Tax=Allomuricauda sp. TY007 TaxID=2683200 RepID=UPI0013BF3EAD|nr:hypothetical protein [Muricauda sp. TY007]NDV14920.1 hypothetical protein [Muricauda sp. TY007]